MLRDFSKEKVRLFNSVRTTMVLDDTLKNYFSSAAGASADHTTALRAPPQGATMNTQRSLRTWPPAKSRSDGTGRVDVAAGDASDGVGHSHYRETPGDSRADHSGGGVAAREHCRSQQKCQNHCSDALGDVLSHNIKN